MQDVFITTDNGKKPHNHVGILLFDNSGFTSTDEKHSHVVKFEIAAQYDELGNVIGQSQSIVLEPAGEDYHTHDITNYPSDIDNSEKLNDLDKEKKESQIIKNKIYSYQKAKAVEKDFFESASEDFDFYKSKQWDKDVEAKLRSDDRAMLTLNRIRQNVRLVLGIERNNRTEIRYAPQEGGDKHKAKILSHVAKNILDNTKYIYQKSKAFKDEVIGGRGWIRIKEDFNENIIGKLLIKRQKWDSVKCSPHEEEDLSDCREIFIEEWYPRKELEKLYNKKIDAPKKEFSEQDTVGSENFGDGYMVRQTGTQYDSPTTETMAEGMENIFYDYNTDEICQIECYEKEYRKIYRIKYNDIPGIFVLDGWKEKDSKRLKTIEGIRIFPKTTYRMKKTIFAGNTLLYNDYSDESWNDFPVIPFYGDKTDEDICGIVRDLKDPQREYNKRKSHMIDILTRVAYYVMFYDRNTFVNKREKNKFKNEGSKPGGQFELNNVSRPPLFTQGVKTPNELISAGELDIREIEDISGVSRELQGFLSKQMAGYQMVQLMEQSLQGLSYLFDGIKRAEEKLGRYILRYIRENYTPDRIFRILGDEPPEELQALINQYTPDVIMQLISRDDLEYYDVVVTQSKWNPTYMRAMAMELSKLAAQMPGSINPVTILRYFDLPDADRAIAETQQMQAQQQRMETLPYETELAKTQISANAKTQGQRQMPLR